MIILSLARRGLLTLATALSPQELVLAPIALPSGTVGASYNQTVTASGGTPSYAYAVVSGTLPTGLSLNAATGAITGTPTAASTFNFTITATDAFGSQGSVAYSVTIAHSYASYVASLAPALWFRLNEPSGVTAVNSGSLGTAQNATLAAGAGGFGQTGALGASEACLFDGADTLLTVPAGAYGAYAQITLAALVKVNSAGEGSGGRLLDQSGSLWTASNTTLSARRGADGTAITSTTTGVSYGAWIWLFYTYDDSGDRQIDVFHGASAVVAEYGYNYQTAATGTLADYSGVALSLGNNPAKLRTLDGLIDEFILWNRVLTPVEMQQIVGLSGV